jgi:2'-5' RNA ligase
MTERPAIDLPENAARLEAGLWALLQAETDEELRAAKRFVAKIMGEAPEEQRPALHAKVGTMLAYMKRATPSGPLPAGPLARFYAEAYTALVMAGVKIPEGELESSSDELLPHGWGVEETPSGTYQAVKLSEEEEAAGPIQHAKHKFSCTSIIPPASIARAVVAFGKSIPDADLAEDGREAEPHITVKYGTHGDDAAPVGEIASAFPPLKLRVGKLSLFPAKEGADFDVLKFEVEGQGLRRLNRAICELPHTDTHPTYNPHLTVAYLKPGVGKQYLSKGGSLPGTKFAVDEVVFSDADGKETVIPLRGLNRLHNQFRKRDRPVNHAMHAWDAIRHRKARSALHYAAVRAPAGGVWVGAIFYPGGRFIPNAELDNDVKLPNGTTIKGADFKKRVRVAQATGSARRKASRDAATPAHSVMGLAGSFNHSPSAPPDIGRSARAFRVLKAANGDKTAPRLREVATLLAAAVRAADQHKRPALLKALAEIAHMAKLLLPPEAAEADAVKLAYPDGGRLWLVPGVPEDAVQSFQAEGFAPVAPGRWAADDTPEARAFVQEHGYKVVQLQDEGE